MHSLSYLLAAITDPAVFNRTRSGFRWLGPSPEIRKHVVYTRAIVTVCRPSSHNSAATTVPLLHAKLLARNTESRYTNTASKLLWLMA
jgi:hypothetical protein